MEPVGLHITSVGLLEHNYSFDSGSTDKISYNGGLLRPGLGHHFCVCAVGTVNIGDVALSSFRINMQKSKDSFLDNITMNPHTSTLLQDQNATSPVTIRGTGTQ